MGFAKAALVSSLLLLGQQAAALDPIVMKGTKFFYENGTQFYIKGVAYQQDTAAGGASTGSTKYVDPLADAEACKRDVKLLAALNTNTIRTYAIDPTADHKTCMDLLSAAGIYVISDLSEPALSINRDTPSWDVALFDRYKAVVDEMSKYDNVIGFFAGNEVSNNKSNTEASAYVKAAVRDTKSYIKSKGGRWLGVGYAANDDPDIRSEIAHYFNCGDPEESIDYWGYNIYEWCGHSSFQKSGYADQVDFFKNYSVPVFFAEYGCNTQGGAEGRIWEETTALYSDEMTGVISGGIVYMYFEEKNDYGLVKVKGDTATPMKNYNALKSVIAKVDPSSVSSSAYKPTNSPASCPELTENWSASDSLPPTPKSEVCDCMFNTLSCVPKKGLDIEDYGAIFDFICDKSKESCVGISGDASTGVYGAYSMCNAKEKLGYVLDAYYKSLNNAADACDFDGQAVVTKPAGVDSSCSKALSSASAANSVAATATAGSTGGGAATSSNVAAPIPMKNVLTIGELAVGLYALVAMGVGAGMVLL